MILFTKSDLMKIVDVFNLVFWRSVLVLVMVTTSACKEGGLHAASAYTALPKDASPYQATVSIDLAETFPTNKRLLGNNIQWVDRGDELLKKGSTEFSPLMLDKVLELQPTVLRYPGGSLSDLYRWKHGMGRAEKRKKSSRFHGNGDDTIMFGTQEFLRLCQLTGAEPLLTANVITAPPEETLDWIKKINFERVTYKGEPLPKVEFLEVGNEPYLIDDNKKELAITAKEYAKRASSLVAKLRKLDPTVKVGIPLRSDDFDGMPVTPLPGFNKEVLEGYSEQIDFVALHNTYFPFIWADLPSNEEQMYLATMAASNVVSKDLERTRQQLKQFREEKNIPIAITEMNSMFSIGQGKSDEYIQSLTGAMYIADLLSLLSKEPDILMANFWSLTGNWQFGAIDQSGRERAPYKVLKKFHEMLDGSHVNTVITGPSFDIVQTGILTEQQGVSYLSVLGSIVDGGVDGKLVNLWIVNKHPLRAANLSLSMGKNKLVKSITKETLTAKKYFSVAQAKAMNWTNKVVQENDEPVVLEPHSINLITVRM